MEGTKKIIATVEAPRAVGTYSQGVEFNGVYYFSGQIGLDPISMQMREGHYAQLMQVLKNIDGMLKACGKKRSDIIKTTVFMTDLNKFPEVNAAYEDYFKGMDYPARSTVQVAGLPKGAEIEIEVIAGK